MVREKGGIKIHYIIEKKFNKWTIIVSSGEIIGSIYGFLILPILSSDFEPKEIKIKIFKLMSYEFYSTIFLFISVLLFFEKPMTKESLLENEEFERLKTKEIKGDVFMTEESHSVMEQGTKKRRKKIIRIKRQLFIIRSRSFLIGIIII